MQVHYNGWLDDFGDAGRKFDSSLDRERPLSFAVGTGRVIKGWDEALLTMKVGGKRRVIIPPELGYAAKGMPAAPVRRRRRPPLRDGNFDGRDRTQLQSRRLMPASPS